MNSAKYEHGCAVEIGKRAAFVLLAAVFLTLPLRGQQTRDDATAEASGSAHQQASTANQPTQQEILKELAAMKKRIEQLEAELQRKAPDPPAAIATEAPGKPPEQALLTPPAASSAAAPAVNGGSHTKSPKAEPFAFGDFTWLNGNARTKEVPLDTKFFTPEIRADVDYIYDFNHPQDDTIGGSSEVFRAQEVQVTQLGVGGDFHYDNVRARLMTQFGMYSFATPRNDASPARGQWNLDGAYRYLSEAYGGYHFLYGWIGDDQGLYEPKLEKTAFPWLGDFASLLDRVGAVPQ